MQVVKNNKAGKNPFGILVRGMVRAPARAQTFVFTIKPLCLAGTATPAEETNYGRNCTCSSG